MSSASAISRVSVILQELYETEPKARRIVDIAGLSPSNIRFGGSAAETWHAVLGEAQKQGRLQALIDVAPAEYPQRDDLRVAWVALSRALERQPFGLMAPGQPGPAEPERPGSLDLHQPMLGKAHLRQAMVASFDLDELGVLCADLESEFRSAGLDISLNRGSDRRLQQWHRGSCTDANRLSRPTQPASIPYRGGAAGAAR